MLTRIDSEVCGRFSVKGLTLCKNAAKVLNRKNISLWLYFIVKTFLVNCELSIKKFNIFHFDYVVDYVLTKHI